MQQLAAEGHQGARRVLDRIDHLDLYIAASQLGITMASLGLGWVGEPALAHLIEPGVERIPGIPEGWREAAKHTVAFVVAFSAITALHIVLGEQVPKTLAIRRPEGTALATAGPVHVFLAVFRPVIAALNYASNAVLRLAGVQPTPGHTLVQSAEELRLSIDASREAGLVEESAHDLVDRAFLFTDLDARHAMVPRTEMSAVPVEATLDEVLEVAMRTGHLRLPVYEGDLDHIVGIVNVKRLLPRVLAERAAGANGGRPPAEPFDLRAEMTEAPAVPETMPASALLTQLRATHTQLAVVIDEYGGTAGIVTLVDLVENLVGEIEDELDPVEPEPDVAPDGSFALDGLTTVVEAKEFYDLDLEAEEIGVETVGGYVFSRLGRPAAVGDEVVVPDGRVLRVEELDGLRVARIRVMPQHAADAERVEVPSEVVTSRAR